MDPWYISIEDITLRLVLSIVLGGLIGFEREQRNRAAGFRTNILVCMGATLIMLLSIYGFGAFVNEPNVRVDPARMAAQAITGIGFLGAGVIIYNGLSVTGLTTAATLWVVAAIGLAVGAGFYYAAVIATFLVLFSLFVLNRVEFKFLRSKKTHLLRVKINDEPGALGRLSDALTKKNIIVKKMMVEIPKQDRKEEVPGQIQLSMVVLLPKSKKNFNMLEILGQVQGVSEVSID